LKKNFKKYKLKVLSDSSNLELVRKFIYDVALKSGLSSEDATKIELAVDEACSNVVRHAYDETVKNDLGIEVLVREDKFVVKVIDSGKGFNPDIFATPDMEEYLAHYKIGGLGIHIIKSLIDKVDFRVKPGIKNEVILTKFIQDKGGEVGK